MAVLKCALNVLFLPDKLCFPGISHVVLCTRQRGGQEGFGDCSAEPPVKISILWSYMLSCWNGVVILVADIITVSETA